MLDGQLGFGLVDALTHKSLSVYRHKARGGQRRRQEYRPVVCSLGNDPLPFMVCLRLEPNTVPVLHARYHWVASIPYHTRTCA